jgi:hypothetical protein
MLKKNRYISVGLIGFFLLILTTSLFAETKREQGVQKGKIITLTANDCFFYPIGNLRAVEEKRTGGTPFNKGWILSHISGWSRKGDTIIWAIKNGSPGELIVKPKMAVLPNQAGSQINVHLNGDTKSLTLKPTGAPDNFEEQQSVSFQIKKDGPLTVKLTIKTLKVEGNIGDLLDCELSGSAINNAEIWNRRWRPLAVHCQWRSSQNPEDVVLAIHENTIHTTNVHMYQPTTTPFGYTGSTWDPKTQTFGGYNFSLWTYGAKEPEPPLEQFSHLIAVGHGYTFGEYGHEGTGVKPRGENPYKGLKTNKQIVAVRKEPGIPYDTYYSYYLHPETNKWTLYGCGKKYNKTKKISYLTTGAFIEEPGPPTRTRNGHIMREVHFSGWLMDKNRQWYPVDVMKHKGDDSSLSYKNWGIKDDEFFMQMGGIKENVVAPANVILPNPPSPENRPDYLTDEMVANLYKLPVNKMEAFKPEKVSTESARLVFDITGIGNSPKTTLFWGEKDALTFDYKWENKKEITLSEGLNKITLKALNSGKKYFYRIRIVNELGTTWLMDTQNLVTK